MSAQLDFEAVLDIGEKPQIYAPLQVIRSKASSPAASYSSCIDFDALSAIAAKFLTPGLDTCDDTAFLTSKNIVASHPVRKNLMPHQIDAVAFLHSRQGAILADDMGLGKTCCAISRCLLDRDAGLPSLVVTPAGLRNTWVDEIARIDPSLTVVAPNNPDDITGELPDFTIISFSRLNTFYNWRELRNFKLLIVDEAHGFKNARSFTREQRANAVGASCNGEKVKGHRTALLFDIAKGINNIYCLTGTPVLNRPKELFNLLRLIRHPLGRDFLKYTTLFCGGEQTRFGWHSDGCTNTAELQAALKNIVLRRTKSSVISLPPKETQIVLAPLSDEWRFKYKNAWREYVQMIKATRTKEKVANAYAAKHLVLLNLLRQICSQSKADHVITRLMGSTEKHIVFTASAETLSSISDGLLTANIDHVCYHGGMNEAKRHSSVLKFRNDPNCKAFVSNIEAGKTGLTLIEATRVIFTDMVWTPADHYQAEDRAYRIGQKNTVMCEYLISPDTVDEDIYDLLLTKKTVIERILGGLSPSNESAEEVSIEGDFLTKLLQKANAAIEAC